MLLLLPRLLTAACRLLPCCCFSILLLWKNAPAGQENTMALQDGIMRCSGNLGGLTSLLKPYIKHMFQLLDALSVLRFYCCCCCWWWWWPASCLLPPRLLTAACRLLPCCCFSILLPWNNAPAGQENTMALKDGIMRCNGNLGGLTSFLKPYIKQHMFQLLDARGLPPACCLLACSLLPAACCLAAASASFCHEKTHLPDRKTPWHWRTE